MSDVNNGHFDFIEIGTSDFDTLIEEASDLTRGISIEPIKYYLDRLPDKKNVIKVNGALSDVDGTIDIFYIEESKINEYNLPYWVRGCNSVNRKHPYVIEKIGEDLYDKIATVDKVPTISWSSLISQNQIKSIGYLKIDTEGYDHIILKEYFKECAKNPNLLAKKILFECNQISNKQEIESMLSDLDNYDIVREEDDIILNLKEKNEKSYVLYSNEKYFDIVSKCVESIRLYSELPIYVYLLNSDKKININNVTTIRWNCEIDEESDKMYVDFDSNFYINRGNMEIYKLLIQRPLIVKDVLEKYSNMTCYVDSDSVATKYVDNIFSFYDSEINYPYFTEGIYDYLHIDGRGGAESKDDLSTTLEHPACELFGVNQYIRERYRQTGYFVSNLKCIKFLDEWYEMCINDTVMSNIKLYAPYNEETIANVLLWKYNTTKGLPYIYTNGGPDLIDKVYTEFKFNGGDRDLIKLWESIPTIKENLLFFHGEKRIDVMEEMINKIGKYNNMGKIKVLFLAPHLSTGGMPGFLLKRIEELNKYQDKIELFVVEFSNFSPVYVVQKNRIIEIIKTSNFYTLGSNKNQLIDIIKDNKIDVVHIEEMIEGFESFNQVPKDLMDQIYSPNRTWRVVETCHNVWFDPDLMKIYNPDAYAFCTPFHPEITFSKMKSYGEVIEFPIDDKSVGVEEKIKSIVELGLDINKKHIINVGLWTSGKNQKEGIEIARIMQKTHPDLQFHFVGNQASNFKEYWEPIMKDIPSNVKIWGERNDVDLFMKAADVFMFNSTWECNPLVLREAISYGLKILSRNLPQYKNMFTPYITPIEGDLVSIFKSLTNLLSSTKKYEIPQNQSEIFAKKHIDLYNKIVKMKPNIEVNKKSTISISQNFICQPFLEIKGESDSNFEVKFFDESDNCIYTNTIKSNSWVKLNREYYTKWNTKVWENGTLIYNNTLDLKGKRVYISFDSRSLGDSVAWIPYLREFKKKHECDVIVSTFWNKLFTKSYPDIEFIEPGMTATGIIAMYKIGWFYNSDREPELPNTIPLQKTITNILGLEFKEIKPDIDFVPDVNKSTKKYVTIANESTAGCKYWNNPNGWQELVDYFISKGYDVINVSKNGDKLKDVSYLQDTSIENTMNCIHHSEFFVGLSSGLSWLAWGIGKRVVMISNFTEEDHEFTINCTRITNKSVCNGCWNNPNFKFDKGDWNWCPVNKGTDKQFECHKSITSQMVIKKIENMYDVNPDFDWGWMNETKEGRFHKDQITKETFEDRMYERFFKVEKGDIVMDIGASVGPFTYSILDNKPKHVFCVEPSEVEFKTLVNNTIGHPVTQILKGISDSDIPVDNEFIFGSTNKMESITFKKLCDVYGINKIDFMKTDCEGGEYDIFNEENFDFIKANVKKITGEWHFGQDDMKLKFRKFRDTYLSQFKNHEIFSLDGVNIKWDLWNDHFIEYYREVIIYIDNRS